MAPARSSWQIASPPRRARPAAARPRGSAARRRGAFAPARVAPAAMAFAPPQGRGAGLMDTVHSFLFEEDDEDAAFRSQQRARGMVSSPPPPQAQAQAQAQAYGAAGAGAHTQGALGGYALPEAAETYALPAQEGYYGANEAYEAPVAAGGAQASEYYATLRLEPETFDEVWDAALEALQDGKTLILSTRHFAEVGEAQRAVDFLSGSTLALGGHIESVGDGIFLFTPASAQVSIYGQDTRGAMPGRPSLFGFLSGFGGGR